MRASRHPGAYVLLFHLASRTAVAVGRLGTGRYPAGWYAYVGSAMGGLAGRLGHHTGPHPKPRWHIDYLLPRSRLVAILTAESPERLECNLARGLAKQFHVFGGFGSSDCRCKGHLFHARRLGDLKLAAAEAVRRRGYEPIMLSGKGVQRG